MVCGMCDYFWNVKELFFKWIYSESIILFYLIKIGFFCFCVFYCYVWVCLVFVKE